MFIENYGGDAKHAFSEAGHSDEAWKLAQTFKVGRLKKGAKPPARVGRPTLTAGYVHEHAPGAANQGAAAREGEPLDIPWAVRWLVPNGERFANFDIINDNDTQLEYARRFGHLYAVGIPTKKWRLVVVSDPELLDEVATNEEQFGKRVEDINFFDQLAGSRGGGISVVSDSEYYDRVRRIMSPGMRPRTRRRSLSGARPSEAAAARIAAEQAAEEALTSVDSEAAMALSLDGRIVELTIMTNAVGITTTPVRALVCRELQAPESPSRTRHLEVSLPDGFSYTAGDHLGVCPKNDPEIVEELARRLGAALDGVFAVPKSMKVRAVPKGVPLQVRNVLTCLVDITSMPSVALIELLLAKVIEPNERQRLEEIKSVLLNPDGPDSPSRAALRGGGYNVPRLLDEFQSCAINIFEFLQVAQPLRPRYYSTSTSPRIHGADTAHIAVGSQALPVPGMPGREFRGMSSHYVHTLREGDQMNVFLDRAEGFHLQEDATKPMIFVSAGTGYAPMRAFLWERLAMKREDITLAPAMLFNGIRSSKLDYIYRDEIEMFVREGVLEHLHVALSREVPGKRDYVQHRIAGQGSQIWKLVQEGAYVYVCGSQTMRDDVRAAFVRVLAEHGSLTTEGAEAYMERMDSEGRYRPDIWA